MADKIVLEAEVKSNIGKQAKATEEWGSAIKDTSQDLDFQKKILIEMEKDLIALEKAQAKMGKGSWQDSLTGTTKKIEAQKAELKEQRLTIKDMTLEQRKATKELKKYNKEQKENEKAIKSSIGQFEIFGVSLNNVKGLFTKATTGAKLLFRSITAGIMSTGIGALLIAFGSLMTYLTSTKEGMDKLSVTIAKISAGFNVIKDRIAGFGKIVGNIFNKKLSETLSDVKDNFKGIGDEMKEEVKEAGELQKATNKLRDINNEFIITQAKKNKQIAEARLLSEDETLSAQERLTALQNAQKLEKELVKSEVENQRERVRILEAQTKMSNSTAADEKKLAEAKVQLINVETKSLKQQKKLAGEMNSLKNEIAAEEQKRVDDENARKEQEQADADALKLKQEQDAATLLALQQENTLALIEDLRTRALAELKIEKEKEMALAEEMENSEAMKLAIKEKYDRLTKKVNDDADKEQKKKDKALMKMKVGFAADTLGAISKLAGEETALGKAAAIAQATVTGTQSVISAFNTASQSPLNAIIPGYNFVQAGLAAAFAAKTIKDISSSKPPSGSGGGGGGGASASTEGPAPQMMSGAFELGGGVEPEPTKAFVVTDEMTNSQNQLSNIRRRATI